MFGAPGEGDGRVGEGCAPPGIACISIPSFDAQKSKPRGDRGDSSEGSVGDSERTAREGDAGGDGAGDGCVAAVDSGCPEPTPRMCVYKGNKKPTALVTVAPLGG